MLIFLKSVASKTIAVTCHQLTLIIELKLHVYDQFGIPMNQQILFFNGKRMELGKMLLDYGVLNENAMVQVVNGHDSDYFDPESIRTLIQTYNLKLYVYVKGLEIYEESKRIMRDTQNCIGKIAKAVEEIKIVLEVEKRKVEETGLLHKDFIIHDEEKLLIIERNFKIILENQSKVFENWN